MTNLKKLPPVWLWHNIKEEYLQLPEKAIKILFPFLDFIPLLLQKQQIMRRLNTEVDKVIHLY